MRRLILALLLIAAPLAAQNRIITTATAAQFFGANDARYVNVTGDTMTGTLTGTAGTVAAPSYRFGAGYGMFSGGTYLAWGNPATSEVFGAWGGSALALQSDGTLCLSNSATDPVAPAGVCWSQSPAGSWLSSGPVVTPDLRFTGTTTPGLVPKSLTTVQRDALTVTSGERPIIWNSTDSRFQMYNGTTWHEWLRRDGTDELPVGTGTARYKPRGVFARSVANVSTTGTAQEVLATVNVPANTITATSRAIRVMAWGTTAANTNGKVMRIRLTNTSGATLTAVSGSVSGTSWMMDVIIARSGAATQESLGTGTIGSANGSVTTTSLTIDPTAAFDLVITGTTATAAGDATLVGWIAEAIP